MSVHRYTNIRDIDSSELRGRGRGRPTITFGGSSERSKRRKCELLYKKSSLNELTETTAYALRKKGNKDTAKLVKEATNTTPTGRRKIRGMVFGLKIKIN
ncbi:Hypothetical protein CINCED_3A000600 [Cinara cedri]|uniref:Uncharacterized protein n=1 Tax=Cinara cedri TaxID=506608 RepID=A0A5E4MAX2_9HEMI|nr:Hypothetical protein CINCED_3A000600 [Cinara cedri]